MKSIASTSWYVNENGSIDSSVTRARTQLRSRIFLSAAINLSTFLTKSQLTQMSSRVRHRYNYFKHKRRQYTFLCQKYLLPAFFLLLFCKKSIFGVQSIVLATAFHQCTYVLIVFLPGNWEGFEANSLSICSMCNTRNTTKNFVAI